MKWLAKFFHSYTKPETSPKASVQSKLHDFLAVLRKHDRVITLMSEMEEKLQKAEPFDIHYIRSNLLEMRTGMEELVEYMIRLGGESYEPLRNRCSVIESEISKFLPGSYPIPEDHFTIGFDKLDRDQAKSVGSKNAQLGEMKTRLNLPVPEGFAITAWGYKHFLDSNNLKARIDEYLDRIDLTQLDELEQVSQEVQMLIKSSPIPNDLEKSICESYSELKNRVPLGRVALRSSAIAEDTIYSFAGQYATKLNVRENNVIHCYKEILASLFSPKAIYYLLGHTLSETEFAMSVGCVAMVDAAASGVVYTMDPIHPEEDCLLVHSVFGLGKSLVDGILTPDVFRISRKERTIKERQMASKPTRFRMLDDEGIVEEAVPPSKQNQSSISDSHLQQLIDCALQIEEHYGVPQDIEWAIDQENRLCFLQTRPLRVIYSQDSIFDSEDSTLATLLTGGETVYPGVGGGRVFHSSSIQNLQDIPEGVVLVAPHPFPGLVTVMDKVNGLVTEIGSVASHMATLAREFRLPTLVGVKDASKLPEGEPITIDATHGQIYSGLHPKLEEKGSLKFEVFEHTNRYRLLKQILSQISPLNLLNPSDDTFIPENCQTYHDIIRFVHQKSLEEMFSSAKRMREKQRIGVRLQSEIPLPVNIISIDENCYDPKQKFVEESQICSPLMRSFWNGIKEEGWPSQRPSADLKGFMSAVATTMTMGSQPEFQENSFAIISNEYMILSLNLGYHFTTIEAICMNEKSYIRFQHKGGGAPIDRRIRRVTLLADIFSKMGFEHIRKSDFFEGKISYLTFQEMNEKLRVLGRLCMMTKQMDMALSNDAIAEWYRDDIIKKLKIN